MRTSAFPNSWTRVGRKKHGALQTGEGQASRPSVFPE